MDLKTFLETEKKTSAWLAPLVGVKPAAIRHYASGRRVVPANRCARIQAATGGKVTRHELRPDLFDPDPVDSMAVPMSEAA